MPDIVDLAATLLRSAPAAAPSLERLYRDVEAAYGPQPGGTRLLYERVRQRPDLFVVLEREMVDWASRLDEEERAEYEESLRRAGIEMGPRIMLAATPAEPQEPPAGDVLQRMRDSLRQLARHAAEDQLLGAEVLEALDMVGELGQRLGPGIAPGIKGRARPPSP